MGMEMKSPVFICANAIVIALILSQFAVAQSRWQREAREYGWLTDYQTAKDEARETGKPIMLVFRCVP